MQKANIVRRTYDTCMEWISKPFGIWVLFLIAFVESSIFPIPPDVFLIALCVALPKKSFKFAAVCTLGSVLGGMFGYGLGFWFMDSLGQMIMELYSLADKYQQVQAFYQKYDVWAVGAAGFTPIPYKLFTISAGFFQLDFFAFVLVSIVSRAARFFLVAVLIWKFGAPIKIFIEKYFNILCSAFLILLCLGFFVVKLV
ncbi:MAG: DedA family protein [Desulfotalea sp.]